MVDGEEGRSASAHRAPPPEEAAGFSSHFWQAVASVSGSV